MQAFTEWFDGLEDSEQRILKIAAVFFGLVILIFGIIKPAKDSVSAMATKVAGQERSIAEWKRDMPLLLANRGQAVGNVQANRPLSTIITSSTRQFGLKVSRVQEKNANEMQVWMDNVPFNDYVRWVAELEGKHQLAVTSVNIRNKERNGLINADIKVQRG